MGKFKKKNGVEYFYANDMVVSVEKSILLPINRRVKMV